MITHNNPFCSKIVLVIVKIIGSPPYYYIEFNAMFTLL